MTLAPIELHAGVEYRGVELAIAGANPLSGDGTLCIDLMVISREKNGGSASGDARRAMEQLASHHAEKPIRVATLTPSGRPIALQAGERANLQVSASHAGSLIVAACRASYGSDLGIGVDLVDPASAGRGLDWWDGDTASVSKTNAERAPLWASREAAYKAAMVDVPFTPAKVAVAMIGDDGFEWRIDTPGGAVGGLGRFFQVADYLLAVAVELQEHLQSDCFDGVAQCS